MAQFVVDHNEVAPVLPGQEKAGAAIGLLGVDFQMPEAHLLLQKPLVEEIADALHAPLLEVGNAIVVGLGLLAAHGWLLDNAVAGAELAKPLLCDGKSVYPL